MTAPAAIRTPLHDLLPDSPADPGPFGFRLLVAPASGRVRHVPPAWFDSGHEWVAPGQAVALVDQGATTVTVESPIAARVAGVLVRDGEPVVRGQPLVWLDLVPRDTAGDGGAGGDR